MQRLPRCAVPIRHTGVEYRRIIRDWSGVPADSSADAGRSGSASEAPAWTTAHC
ncbi:MAG: hypothetical protein V7631_2490 [Massilia sp.]|jgi:hypothetical protein